MTTTAEAAPATPSLLDTAAVASLLGVSRETVSRWTIENHALRACVQVRSRRRLWFSRQKLIDGGWLVRTAAPLEVAP